MAATQRDTDLAAVKAANAIEDGLNSWEVEFIESLNRWMSAPSAILTDKQRLKLEAILTTKG
jgi:hypothetical protein